ncbi:hypothetical protein N9K75_03085, partial [bacterium]|nr:hypothetical protein [bacterium]
RGATGENGPTGPSGPAGNNYRYAQTIRDTQPIYFGSITFDGTWNRSDYICFDTYAFLNWEPSTDIDGSVDIFQSITRAHGLLCIRPYYLDVSYGWAPASTNVNWITNSDASYCGVNKAFFYSNHTIGSSNSSSNEIGKLKISETSPANEIIFMCSNPNSDNTEFEVTMILTFMFNSSTNGTFTTNWTSS